MLGSNPFNCFLTFFKKMSKLLTKTQKFLRDLATTCLCNFFFLTLPLLTLLLLTALLWFPQNARYIVTSVLWYTLFSVFEATPAALVPLSWLIPIDPSSLGLTVTFSGSPGVQFRFPVRFSYGISLYFLQGT